MQHARKIFKVAFCPLEKNGKVKIPIWRVHDGGSKKKKGTWWSRSGVCLSRNGKCVKSVEFIQWLWVCNACGVGTRDFVRMFVVDVCQHVPIIKLLSQNFNSHCSLNRHIFFIRSYIYCIIKFYFLNTLRFYEMILT